ncbi:hypothetical protein NPIL_197311 [Nephila pilipes]|uniref:Uncharacterized protein n=1 Tax=Nephila pilipes TaxID=299642 RepID=A0A8X6PJK4_NEPPI|nr:hypothetical protein NPIL_197311 [Nephila pilipes]
MKTSRIFEVKSIPTPGRIQREVLRKTVAESLSLTASRLCSWANINLIEMELRDGTAEETIDILVRSEGIGASNVGDSNLPLQSLDTTARWRVYTWQM